MKLVLSGMAAFILSWVLTGCRFGNFYEITNTVTGITGYYETEPQSLAFCATLNGQPPQACPSANVSDIPNALSQMISQPVVLQVLDNATGASALYDPFTSVSPIPWFPVYADEKTLLINYERVDQPTTLWRDPSCLVQTNYEVRGRIRKGTPTVVRGKTTLGRLTLAFSIKDQFIGTCSSTLSALADCYQDPNTCGESSPAANLDVHRQSRAYLGPYIDHHAVTIGGIPSVTAFDYQVSYE